jgi:hypothetical protein
VYVYHRTLYARCPTLLTSCRQSNGDSTLRHRESVVKKVTEMSDINASQSSTLYRVRIKDGHNAVGLLVSAAGSRCIPSTQLWLTADASAAYCFPRNVTLRIQLRLGTLGFTTALEEIQD